MTDHELDESPHESSATVEPGSALREAAPGRLVWERHDRTHLEITLQYPVPAAGDLPEHVWEAYYFLPETFRLDASNYSKPDLFSDFRSYVRFSVPPLDLDAVPGEAATLAERLLAESPDAGVQDLKLFANRVRRAIDQRAHAIDDAMPCDDWENVRALVNAFVTSGDTALVAVRDVVQPWKLRGGRSFEQADPELAKAASWVDEYLSRVFELALVDIAASIQDESGPKALPETLVETAVAEARYRRAHREGPVSSIDGSVHDLERIERRQHSLKRFMSSVLWLDVEVREGYAWQQHALYAVAAGIAMTFAVVVAVVWGQPGVSNRLGLWAAIVVVAYMGKDRLKVLLQNAFDKIIATRLPDRRWEVRSPGSPEILAEVAERAGFVERTDLPEEIEAARRVSYRDRLEELAGPESVMHHSKTVRIHRDVMAASAPEFSSLADVMRIDVSRWLVHSDDAKRTVTLADPEAGEMFRSKLPRAYDVTLVYRLIAAGSETPPWTVARVVVSRNGIRRVGVPKLAPQ